MRTGALGRQLFWLAGRTARGRPAIGPLEHSVQRQSSYEYGEEAPTDLLTSDLLDLARRQLIDMWFWGNTHYCALFNHGTESPFIGSCIGHGGFPYGRKRHGEPSPAPLEFLETQARFPASTGPAPRARQQRILRDDATFGWQRRPSLLGLDDKGASGS